MYNNTQGKGLKSTTVMTERHVSTQRNALHLNYVPNIETTLNTVHQLARNGNSNNRDCNVIRFLCWDTLVAL
jgi:hypothetical protein